MIRIMPFALVTVIGLILVAGCVAATNKNIVNSSPAIPDSPTTDSGLNATPTVTPPLNGSLRVSVAGFSYPTNLSVLLDNQTVGTVNPTSPLYLMATEGNHTIEACADFVCEKKQVMIRYGRYLAVDFSEQLQNDVVIKQPTAQVLEYHKNGNHLWVDIEFINPSKKDVQMSAAVSCGYSYVDDRSGIKKGDSLQGTVVQRVNAGQRVTKGLDFDFAKGDSLSYSNPVIEDLKIT